MKKAIQNQEVSAPVEIEQSTAHPMQKSYMFISTKHVDYNDLSAFEAVSLSAVMVLAVLVGVIQTTTLV